MQVCSRGLRFIQIMTAVALMRTIRVMTAILSVHWASEAVLRKQCRTLSLIKLGFVPGLVLYYCVILGKFLNLLDL